MPPLKALNILEMEVKNSLQNKIISTLDVSIKDEMKEAWTLTDICLEKY